MGKKSPGSLGLTLKAPTRRFQSPLCRIDVATRADCGMPPRRSLVPMASAK